MGKVIQLREEALRRSGLQPLAVRRPEQAGKAAELALVKLLASLSSAGVPEMALDALIRWGEGQGKPVDLLESVQSLAAVSGVRLPWFGEEGGAVEWFPS